MNRPRPHSLVICAGLASALTCMAHATQSISLPESELSGLVLVVPHNQERVFDPQPEFYAVLSGTVTHENSIKAYLDERSRRNRGAHFPAAIKPVDTYSLVDGDHARIRFSGGEIIIFRNGGFESISHLLTYWTKHGNMLQLESILSQEIKSGIGTVFVDSVNEVPGDSRRFLIAGRTHGGDGGETWGNIWFGDWKPPSSLKTIYEIGFKTTFDCKCEETANYELDATSLKAKIHKRQRRWVDPELSGRPNLSPWREISEIEIALREYL